MSLVVNHVTVTTLPQTRLVVAELCARVLLVPKSIHGSATRQEIRLLMNSIGLNCKCIAVSMLYVQLSIFLKTNVALEH